MRTPFISPCGVDETTGTLVSFSRGTITSSVLKAPQPARRLSSISRRCRAQFEQNLVGCTAFGNAFAAETFGEGHVKTVFLKKDLQSFGALLGQPFGGGDQPWNRLFITVDGHAAAETDAVAKKTYASWIQTLRIGRHRIIQSRKNQAQRRFVRCRELGSASYDTPRAKEFLKWRRPKTTKSSRTLTTNI